MGLRGKLLKKTEALYTEFNKRAEAATSSYSVTDDFLQCIHSVSVAKNHQIIRSRCLLMNFPSHIFFKDINHG